MAAQPRGCVIIQLTFHYPLNISLSYTYFSTLELYIPVTERLDRAALHVMGLL